MKIVLFKAVLIKTAVSLHCISCEVLTPAKCAVVDEDEDEDEKELNTVQTLGEQGSSTFATFLFGWHIGSAELLGIR